MKSRILANIFCLLFFPFLGSSQYLDSLNNIISSDITHHFKRQKVDFFLQKNQTNIKPNELADCYHESGKWFYKTWKKQNKNKDLTKAIFYTKKALDLKKSFNSSTTSLKKTLYNLANFHSWQGNYPEAINYYKEIKDIHHIDTKTLSALRAISNNYVQIGDFHKALTNLNTLISISAKDTTLRKRTIQAYVNRADVYSSMGRKKFSEEIKQDVEKADSLLALYSLKKNKYHYRIYQIEGNRLLENGYYKGAITYFEKTLKGITKKDSINRAIVYNSIGNAYGKLKEYKRAYKYFNIALSYNPSFSPIYENIGDIYIDQLEFTKGLNHYQKAINTLCITNGNGLQDDISIKTLEVAREKYDLLYHLIQKAKAWIVYYHYNKNKEHLYHALRTFETADKLIDIIRFESTEHKSKLYWRQKGASLYQGAVEVCYLLNKPEKAFYFMEKNKAILLLEDITNQQAKENAKLPFYVSKKELDLKRSIHFMESKLQQALEQNTDSIIDSRKRKLYISKRKYEIFIDSLVQTYPEYRKYKKLIPIISYEHVLSKYITKDELILQYITDNHKGYGLLLTPQKPILFQLNNTTDLFTDIKKLQQLVTQKFITNQQKQDYNKFSHQFFQKLIPKVIFQHIKGKKVTIVPDYMLHQISFETLITSTNPDNFFIQDTEINYAYSISHLINNEQISRNTKHKFLGIAPIRFDSLNLPLLQHSLQEVETINDHLSGEVLLKEQANKVNFIQNASQYGVIHLATHAGINATNSPWIAFYDDKLSLQEIYGYKNQHEVVSLSACKTSVGQIQMGEGVMSLARGFFYGGAKSVVSSLWSTNDKSNKKIMIDFYLGLKKGLSKSTALRQAKLNYIQTHQGSEASPFYWGALVLIGDSGPVNINNHNVNTGLTIVTLILFIITIIILLRIKFLKAK
ncbi:CHAT domain-containing protein [Aquimarina sp. AU474]|uniref:CHAT domain-containing protein n=1 Tax=Aquimarina sp. AU474 TaxID=2108529 RepID=UPI000D696BB9|nr:CHAT domain-containing protein [Aquimarina sp. AU474]